MRFLITAIGSISADAVITSLRTSFPGCEIIGTDIHPKEWLYISQKVDRFYTIPRATDSDFIPSLNSILREHSIDFILPLTDPEVDILSANRRMLDPKNALLALPKDEVIKKCRNKDSFSKMFRQIRGINTIESFTKDKLQKREYSFPLVAKLKKGRSSERLRYINSEMEFSAIDDNFIIQPFIQGDIITVDFVKDDFGNIVCLPRKELIRSANGAGLTAEIYQDKVIEKLITKITDVLDIRGCMNIEFILKDGSYYLMDINPRFSAGIGFSVLGGYDFIRNHIHVYQGKEIEPFEGPEKMIVSKYYIDKVIAKTEDSRIK